VLAVLVGPIGLCFALYIAVAEKMASARRHAIGVAGVSILSIAVSMLIYTMLIAPGASASKVADDLKYLLNAVRDPSRAQPVPPQRQVGAWLQAGGVR
jgi:Na+-transporting NADH:ubiquinone oxidoreductase subunit NqrE